MSAEVIPYPHPGAGNPVERCDCCGERIRKHMASNTPAYCSYECAIVVQRDKAAVVMNNVPGVN